MKVCMSGKTTMPSLRFELRTFRLWDWRAAYCAKKALRQESFSRTIDSLSSLHKLSEKLYFSNSARYEYVLWHIYCCSEYVTIIKIISGFHPWNKYATWWIFFSHYALNTTYFWVTSDFIRFHCALLHNYGCRKWDTDRRGLSWVHRLEDFQTETMRDTEICLAPLRVKLESPY